MKLLQPLTNNWRTPRSFYGDADWYVWDDQEDKTYTKPVIGYTFETFIITVKCGQTLITYILV